MKNLITPVFWAILISGTVYRFWGITNPLLDFHHFRQTYTALFSKKFYEGSMNIFQPDLGIYNYINISEFHLYTYTIALLYKWFGFHEIFGRLVSILCSVVAMYYLYLLVKKTSGERASLFSLYLFAFLPLSAFYSRVFMLESMMILLSILSVYYLNEWLENQKNSSFFIAIAFLALTLLIKIPTLYMGIPVLFLFLNRFGMSSFQKLKFYMFGVLSLLPSLIWYFVIPKLNPASSILSQETSSMYFHPEVLRLYLTQLSSLKTYKELFLHRFIEYHLSFIGFIFLAVGLYFLFRDSRNSKNTTSLKSSENGSNRSLVYLAWLGGIFVFIFGMVAPNLAHEYYQLPVIPPSCALAGIGADRLLQHWESKKKLQWGIYFLFFLLLPMSFTKYKSRIEIDWFYKEYADRILAITKREDAIALGHPMPRTEVFYYADREGYYFNISAILYGSIFVSDKMQNEMIQNIEDFRVTGAKYLGIPYIEFQVYLPKVHQYLESKYVNVLADTKVEPSATRVKTDSKNYLFPGVLYDLRETKD